MMPFNFSFWRTSLVKGSVLIGGNVNNGWLTSVGSADWAVGTGDFTIEWFQYQTNNGNENFIFNVGTKIIGAAVSSGGGKLNVYLGGGNTPISNANVSISLSTWYHVAISRSGSTLNVYFNGTRIDSISNSTNVNDSSSTLYIGTQNNTSPYGDNWPGNITNFRWVKGSALYTGTTLTIPTTNLTNVSNTKLLLLFGNSSEFLTDTSGLHTITNPGVPTWSNLSPF